MRQAVIFTFILCLAAPLLAHAQSAQFDADRFRLSQGVFCSRPAVDEMLAPGTLAGKIELFAEVPEFEWTTAVVPAVLGLSFGVKTDALDGRLYDGVVLTLTHPPFTGSETRVQSYVTSLGGSGTSINAYTFDLPEEVQTGIWTFTATREGEELYTARFNVVPPETVPEMAGACGMAPMS